MGLHQDKDEADFSWPVLSISRLGDDALFRIGNHDARRQDRIDLAELGRCRDHGRTRRGWPITG